MKRATRWLCFFLLSIFVAGTVQAADFSAAPVANNGQKWRVGYLEGGPYIDYQKIFTATVLGLMDLGWIEKTEIPPQKGEETEILWQWLSKNIKSDYIEFVADGWHSAGWDEAVMDKMVPALIDRLNTKKDIDLMIAAGTAAGKSLANDRHQTPVMVMSASDPIGSGIVKSVEDSGLDHVHARVDPDRYERQIQIFHDIIGFTKLGVAHEDSSDGYTYAAMDKVKKVAGERGFGVVTCYSKDEVPKRRIAENSVIKCFEELVQKADAIYVTNQNGVNTRSIPKLVEIVNGAKIPTFSQASSDEVRYGFLMSISQAGFRYVGRFFAETAAKILNGAKPRQLVQLFEEPPKIAINMKTTELVGFDPPVDVLGAADEIYQEIETPAP